MFQPSISPANMNNGIHRRDEYSSGNSSAGGNRHPVHPEMDTPSKKRKIDKEVCFILILIALLFLAEFLRILPSKFILSRLEN